MEKSLISKAYLGFGFASLLLLAACTSRMDRAPVIDRLPSHSTEAASNPTSSDGYYIVKQGDTLYSISLDSGMDWRELARMNGLADPNRLIVGQKLRVTGASGSSTVAAAVPDTADSGVVVTPVPSAGGSSTAVARPIDSGSSAPTPVAIPEAVPVPADPSVSSKPVPAASASASGFIWPHAGSVIQQFKSGVNKGIDLAAKVGDPVVASLGGRVVYAGSGLRGYGNLIILKHSENLLTAYAHNKTLLVNEGETVKKGQKIAEAGQSDTDRPKLHFEVRKQGKPVDPMEYLPAR